MHGGLLARRLSGRLASSLTCQGPFQTAGYATKAPTGASEREKETKLQTLLKLLAPAPEVEIKFSEAELEEWGNRARQFSSQSMKAHREYQRDLTMRLNLKKAAIAALPPLLQLAAVIPVSDPPPMDRMMFSDTPPQKQERKELPGRGAVRLGTKQRT